MKYFYRKNGIFCTMALIVLFNMIILSVNTSDCGEGCRTCSMNQCKDCIQGYSLKSDTCNCRKEKCDDCKCIKEGLSVALIMVISFCGTCLLIGLGLLVIFIKDSTKEKNKPTSSEIAQRIREVESNRGPNFGIINRRNGSNMQNVMEMHPYPNAPPIVEIDLRSSPVQSSGIVTLVQADQQRA